MQRHNPTPSRIYRADPHVHGSAQWASKAHLKERGYGETGRIFLGYGIPEHNKARAFAITTSTASHGTVMAPTRGWKGVCFVVPHCLDHKGSLAVLDIKDGENALITARYRRDVLGQSVYLLDPWDRAAHKISMKPHGFNPMDWLDPEKDSFVDDAFLLAEALVISESSREPFWSEEAKALIAGLIMHVKTAPTILLPDPVKGRTLGQMRACLNLGPKAFNALISGLWEKDEEDQIHLVTPGMAQSRNPFVVAAAGRIMNKSERERSGVLSTAQANTHFLESPALQQALSKSDFDPADMERGDISIYIILPVDKHLTHSRFLRLMVSVLLTSAARFKSKPNPPVSFVLEEANALGSLPIVPVAYSLLAGLGVQVVSIWQDGNQLAERYPNWQTIISNSGFIQCLGTNDIFTAEYLSKMSGLSTVLHLSEESAALRAGLVSDPHYLSREDMHLARPLITPDELMVMHPSAQLILLAHAHPVTAYKTAYFLDSRYRDKNGQPLFDIHPAYKSAPLPRAVNFLKPGLDIGRALETILGGG